MEEDQDAFNYYDMFAAGLFACVYLSEDTHAYAQWCAALPQEGLNFMAAYAEEIRNLAVMFPAIGERFLKDLQTQVNEDAEEVASYTRSGRENYFNMVVAAMQDRYVKVLLEVGLPDHVAVELSRRMPAKWATPLYWVVNQ